MSSLEFNTISGTKIGYFDPIPLTTAKSSSTNKITQVAKPFLQSIGYAFASIVTFGQKSKYFEAKSTHYQMKADELGIKKHFEKVYMHSARNIAQNEILRDKKDYEASMDLLQQYRKLQENDKIIFSQIQINDERDPEKTLLDGICYGISVDVAQRYLIGGETIESISESLKKGASAEAAANQAVYQMTISSAEVSWVMIHLIEELHRISKQKDATLEFKVNFTAVAQGVIVANPSLQSYANFFKNFAYPTKDIQEAQLMILIHNVQKEELANAELKKESYLTYNAKLQGYVLNNLTSFEEKVQAKIDTLEIPKDEKKRMVHTLKWISAFLALQTEIHAIISKQQTQQEPKEIPQSPLKKVWIELYQKARSIFKLYKPKEPENYCATIHDPMRQEVLSSLFKEAKSHMPISHALCAVRGLKMESTKAILSTSTIYKNDKDYLNNLDQLEEGVYEIDIIVKGGAHTITYIKESEKAYIIDPNFLTMRLSSKEQTKEELLKLLKQYSPPVKSKIKNHMDHQLQIYRYQPIDPLI